MGRTYAGILGPIAFVTVVARAIINGGSAENTIISAMIALFVFAAAGLVIGSIAQRIVTDGIEMRFRNYLQDAQTTETTSADTAVNNATS